MVSLLNISFQLTLIAAFIFSMPSARAGNFKSEDPSSLFSKPEFYYPFSTCSGRCSVSFYSGRYVETSMDNIFGRVSVEPIWTWNWRDSGLVAATASRKFIETPEWWSIEAEIGVAKRFGELNSFENWGAIYLRWSAFPWNHFLRTSIAISTGLNYAWSLDRVEVERAENGQLGSHLLHFLSPEITFGLPSHPEWDMLFRFHHRSGAAGLAPPISSALFHHAYGGAQYFTVGFRYEF